MSISQELLEQYNVGPVERYESLNEYYRTFLCQTDITMYKAMEEYIMGKSKSELHAKYKDVIEARKYARTQISEVVE